MNLEHLNPAQRSAVTHQGGPLLILAGAGTGKTRALMHRIAWLIEEGASASGILGVTFTHRAADEMRERLDGLIGATGAAVTLSTFHSLGARLLRGMARRFGRTGGFHIYGEAARLTLLRGILSARGCGTEAAQLEAAAGRIAAAKQGSPASEEVEAALESKARLEWGEISAVYEARLRACDAFDLEDLIARPAEALQADAQLRARLQARWPWVLVDEFQDTNAAQLALLEALAPPGAELTVVGDDDQAIYEWRGADVEGILRFNGRWGGAIIRLEENYRSSKQILTLANGFIAQNTRRLGKTLRAQGEGPAPRLYEGRDDRAEARWVAAQVQRLHEEEGLPYASIAILTRTHLQHRELEAALDLLCVPHDAGAARQRLDGAKVKDALAYLQLLNSPLDAVAARRIILRTVKGVGEKTVARLEAAAAQGEGLLEVAARVKLPPRAARALAGLSRVFEEARAALKPPLAPRIWGLLDEVGLLAEEDAGLDALMVWLRGRAALTLPEILEAFALNARLEGEGGGASLLTIHAAKGLEFEAVFLPGVEAGRLPHVRSEGLDALEAERRLFYVALTRAARHLSISWSRSQRGFGGPPKPSAPSPFLGQLPLEGCEGDIGAVTPQPAGARGASHARLEVGDFARHAKLGRGEVLSIDPSGRGRVRFSDQRIKTVALRFLDKA